MTLLAKIALAAVLAAGVGGGGYAYLNGTGDKQEAPAGTVSLTIKSAAGAHEFRVEMAKTAADQERGLMYRTDIKPDGGMLFAPYPPDGGPPRAASFWMKNTPSPLDIIFIRADHSIAHIADNTVPFSETPIPSGEPIAAVLEIPGGRTADLGIAEDDMVSWGK